MAASGIYMYSVKPCIHVIDYVSAIFQWVSPPMTYGFPIPRTSNPWIVSMPWCNQITLMLCSSFNTISAIQLPARYTYLSSKISSRRISFLTTNRYHDGVIKWRHFPRYWPLCGKFTGHISSAIDGSAMFSLIRHKFLKWRLRFCKISQQSSFSTQVIYPLLIVS